MKARAGVAGVLAAALCVALSASATTPTGPVVGNGGGFGTPFTSITYTTTGEAGLSGGVTWAFSGLTQSFLSQFANVEWGFAPGGVTAAYDSQVTLAFSSGQSNLVNGSAVWLGQTTLGGVSTDLKVVMTASNGSPIGNFIATSGYGDGADVPVTGNFSANVQLLAAPHGTTSFSPFIDYFNQINFDQGGNISGSGEHAVTNITAGLYYNTDAPAVSYSGYDFTVVRQGSPAQHDITITNSGTADLSVGNVQVTGHDFSLVSSDCVGSPIASGHTCTATVQYAPTQDGQEQGALVLTDNAADSPQSRTLNGFGVHATASVSPSSQDFGNVATNQSPSQTFTISNPAGADLHLGTITVTDTTNYAIGSDNCSGSTVPAQNGGSCTFKVTFAPTSNGTHPATVDIPGDTPTGTTTVSLTGVGTTPAPAVSLPASVDFGTQGKGAASGPKTVTLTNSGSLDLHVGSVTPGGDYQLSSDTCSGATVSAGSTCTFKLTFLPTVFGTDPGMVTVTSNASSSPDHVTLTGTGTNSRLAITPNPTNYGDVQIGGTAKTLTITIANSGSDPTHLLGPPTATGPNQSDFSLLFNTLACTSGSLPTLNPSASCTIGVAFNPLGTGLRTETLTFPNDSSDGPVSVTLQGNGINPAVSLSPSPFTFTTPQPLNTTQTQDVTLKNTGTTALAINSISSGGDFTADGTACGAALNAGASCLIHVHFTPSAAGTRTGTLTVNTNAQTSPDTVSLSGTGIDPKLSGPASTSFGSVLFNASTTQTITVSSSGTTPLSIQSAVVSGTGFSTVTDNCSGATISPTGSCNVTVKFAPGAGGHFIGALTITSNAPTSPDALALVGDGIGGTFASSPVSGLYGSVVDGTLKDKTFTISNTGGGSLSFTGISLTGGNAGSFSIDGGTCTTTTTLTTGTCTIIVGFTPVADGPYSATLHLSGNGTNNPFDIPLTGTGVSPHLDANPVGLIFGITPIVGHLTAGAPTQTVSAMSDGTSAVTITVVSVTGPFVLTGDACSGTTMAPGHSCQTQVAFVPSLAGLAHGTLKFLTADGETLTAALSGTGLDVTPPVLGGWTGPATFNAIGPAGAVVAFTSPTATDNVDGTDPVVCSPASGSLFAIGTDTVNCYAVDAAGNKGTASYTITVLGAPQQATNLKNAIAGLASLQGTSGPVTNLRNKLQNDMQTVINALAQKQQAGHPNTACSPLANFIKDATNTGNLQPKGPLSAADSAYLVSEATRIKAVISC